MARIRYVCLSDLHFGQMDGVLTQLDGDGHCSPLQPSRTLEKLVACLRELNSADRESSPGEPSKPTLLLVGDILEIALATTNEACMAFERFVELIMPEKREDWLFDDIYYVPGNHDHHIWEMARETQFVHYLRRCKPGQLLDHPWHDSRLFEHGEKKMKSAYLLTNLIQRYEHIRKEEFVVRVAYPNYGLFHPQTGRCVVLHHGHFVEKIYRLMTDLATKLVPGRIEPTSVGDIELENFAWIDFFWSTMGRSGQVGKLVQNVYNSLGVPRARTRFLRNLGQSLADMFIPWFWRWLGRKMLCRFLPALATKIISRERTHRGDGGDGGGPLSAAARQGLDWYLNVPVHGQVTYELREHTMREMTFLFGHTHKPYHEALELEKYPAKIRIFNMGGWVVDGPNPQSSHGGAAVLLDEELNATLLHLYQENEERSPSQVRVEDTATGDQEPGELTKYVSGLLGRTPAVWKDFATTVASELEVRRGFLSARLERIAKGK